MHSQQLPLNCSDFEQCFAFSIKTTGGCIRYILLFLILFSMFTLASARICTVLCVKIVMVRRTYTERKTSIFIIFIFIEYFKFRSLSLICIAACIPFHKLFFPALVISDILFFFQRWPYSHSIQIGLPRTRKWYANCMANMYGGGRKMWAEIFLQNFFRYEIACSILAVNHHITHKHTTHLCSITELCAPSKAWIL